MILVKKKVLPFWQVAFFVFVFLNVMTFIHELGHYITLKLFGCHPYPPQVWFYFGATSFDCDAKDLAPVEWWIVAYAGPIAAFVVAYYLWFHFGRDSIWRLAALIGFVYGVLPNLVWQIQGTDAYFAVSMGFSPAVATIIMVGALSYIAYLIYKEIAEVE